jgi:hypothetical protein
MSGLAMFSLKFPSLLKFDENREEKTIKHNLQALYGVQQIPCDTYMRERNDEVDPREVRKVYKRVFSQVQREKILEEFSYIDNHYLLAGDGTGFFKSNRINCENCCIKQHNKCHIEVDVELSDNLSDYQPNTYVLIKNVLRPWELYYIDDNRKIATIPISAIDKLRDILLNKSWKSLKPDEKLQVKEMVASYHKRNHPESEVTYYHQMFCAAIVHPDKNMFYHLHQNQS